MLAVAATPRKLEIYVTPSGQAPFSEWLDSLLLARLLGVGTMPRSVPYDDYLIESLKDPKEAEAYLNAALEDEDPRVFLLALRDVAAARGGIGKGAASSRLLSKKGSPGLHSLGALLSSLGFRLAVETKDAA